MQNSTFYKTQRFMKGAIATTLGILNLMGIGFSIAMTQQAPFQSWLSGAVQWLTSPQPLNILGIAQAIFNTLIWAIAQLLNLTLAIISLGHSTGTSQWINQSALLLIKAISHLQADWLTIARIIPAHWLPFAPQLLELITGSDAIAAIILSTLCTAICASTTIWMLSIDIPGWFARNRNQARIRRAYGQLQCLEATLATIDPYELTIEDAEQMRRLMRSLHQFHQPSFLEPFFMTHEQP